MSFRTWLLSAALLATALPACTASSEDASAVDSTDDELPFRRDFLLHPRADERAQAETFRAELEDGDMGHVWVRNQGNVFGVQWESRSSAPLTSAQKIALAKAAFAFLHRKNVRDLKSVASDDGALGAALDVVGLSESSPDRETAAVRAKMLGALGQIARTKNVTVLTASLHDQVDMYWEGALLVIDEDNEQIVISTGGYGT